MRADVRVREQLEADLDAQTIFSFLGDELEWDQAPRKPGEPIRVEEALEWPEPLWRGR